MSKKELIVNAIEQGTVIDHIPAKDLFQVIKILDLKNCENQITFGTNLKSNRLGKKAIIKVENKFFEEEQINKIALVAHQANLNIIKDYKVVKKMKVEIPDQIIGIVKCFNPKCVTNYEQITTKFTVVSKNKLALKCKYCEKITDEEQIIII
ncbi:MAG: aspartate carbamoyltransferase regulatory subunit [Bacteroidales bacterium]|nr:aspartate carbamoyltransferase regulatory subunit [Bacteroidales bacterium]